ncbi:MAG TPA: Nramp family divalent metal transporter [Gemmatimonadaceae bacterium]|nr:Nramp family divalent metal transporter [Gemmatimonadaceae bacterium]
MKKGLQLFLGILTAIGGFFDIGNLVTAAQAGATFRFQLLWALALGTIIVIFLVEMSGRFAAVTKKSIPTGVREHFGVRVWIAPFAILVLLHFLTLAAELGGIAFALQLVTGISFQIWVLPVGVLVWLFLWRATFDAIEYSTATLGLIALCFVVAAFMYHPPRSDVLSGLLPSLPKQDGAKYWLYAVSIIGALIAPYMFYFYSSGAVEDEWDKSYLMVNRIVSITGMSFGAVITAAVIIMTGLVLHPLDIGVDSINQAAFVLTGAFPFWGFLLFAASMGIACTGAAAEVGLSLAYSTAQTFGWNWGESLEPKKDARFALTYTVAIVLAMLLMMLGIDPLKLTIYTMALNAMVLPIVSIPFLMLMNDGRLMREFTNGIFTNAATAIIVLISFVLFVVSIPLVIMGSG